jgi:DNA-directed RNA polymerase specialized sigma24 family protein
VAGAEDEVLSMAFPRRSVADAGSMSVRDSALTSREAGFDRIFEEYSAPIFNYVLRMVGDRDRAADTATRSWLYRIATNTAIDDMRRRRFMVRPTDDEEPRHEQPDLRPGPEAQVMSTVLDERLQRALLRLKPERRQCLLLSDLEDMSAQQIGEVMNISYGAVRTLLCRARGDMRRHLAAEGLTR